MDKRQNLINTATKFEVESAKKKSAAKIEIDEDRLLPGDGNS